MTLQWPNTKGLSFAFTMSWILLPSALPLSCQQLPLAHHLASISFCRSAPTVSSTTLLTFCLTVVVSGITNSASCQVLNLQVLLPLRYCSIELGAGRLAICIVPTLELRRACLARKRRRLTSFRENKFLMPLNCFQANFVPWLMAVLISGQCVAALSLTDFFLCF
jgi:hypothetical protein